MTNWLRVEDQTTGHHITISETEASLDSSRYKILNMPAVDINGLPLPPKPYTPKGTPLQEGNK